MAVNMFNAAEKAEIIEFVEVKGWTKISTARWFKCSVDTVNRVLKEAVPVAPAINPDDVIWACSSKFLSITIGRDTYACKNSHDNFLEARAAALELDFAKAIALINAEKAITSYVNGNVRIEDGRLFYQDIELRSGLIDRIINAMNNGENFQFYLPFLENLLENPSRKAVDRLFDFLSANDITITDDGHFLAWKVIRDDFTDCYTGKFDNSVGVTVKMPRTHVNDNDEVTCSNGLHVCARSYIRHFRYGSDRLVKVKVHPRDVVSIPVDYGDAKMRTCQYLVLEEVSFDEETDTRI